MWLILRADTGEEQRTTTSKVSILRCMVGDWLLTQAPGGEIVTLCPRAIVSLG